LVSTPVPQDVLKQQVLLTKKKKKKQVSGHNAGKHSKLLSVGTFLYSAFSDLKSMTHMNCILSN